MAVEHLIFIRHGQSRHHVDGLTGGWTDTSLTDLGRRQVKKTAQHLRGLQLPARTGLFSSDLKRAAESASIIGSLLGLSADLLPQLREIDNGDATGLTVDEAKAIARPEPLERDLDWIPYANAESYRSLVRRALSALRIIEAAGNETTIVVGHGLSGQALIGAWLELPLDIPIAFNFTTASLTELRINRWGEPQIERMNVEFPAD